MLHLKNKKIALLFALFGCSHLFLWAQVKDPDWTHFRGSKLDGISQEKDLPLSWDDSTGVAWKTAIDGLGWSSPVVLVNQIWVTTDTEVVKEMRALRLDFNS
mgnify:CR=1 FL=1